ncbi:hypothetical protein C0J52_03431 [Blattella germanica]|nr:hypothetical protein C0J52_03431 [Blattella germanica]
MLLLLVCALPILVQSADYIDIGRGFDEGTQYWINVQPFKFTKKDASQKPDGTWYAANEFMTAEHCGTHLDAPYHFFREGWKVGDIPVSKLIVPAVLMDMTDEVNGNPDFELKPNHIKIWEEQHGELPEDSLLLIRYGWGRYYNNRTQYFGFEPRSPRMHFPDTDFTVIVMPMKITQGTGAPARVVAMINSSTTAASAFKAILLLVTMIGTMML